MSSVFLKNYLSELIDIINEVNVKEFEDLIDELTRQKSLVINSNDMQKVEDAHLIILHCVMQWFNAKQKR